MRKTGEQRREEIIDATLALAAERGARDTTTQAIADRVGIAQATVFRHFRTRDAIFAGALEWIGTALFRAIGGPLSNGGSPAARLREVIARQLGFISTHRGIPRLLLSDRLHLENPALKKIALGVMARYTAEIGRLIREGMDCGEFRTDLVPEETAEMLIALIQGLVVRWSLSDFEFALEEKADDVWTLLWPTLRRSA